MPRDHENGDEMHRDVEWMVPSDRPILRELRDVGDRWQKPATLALNIAYSRYNIAERLRILAEHDLAERHPQAAAYRITDRGRAFLDDELSAEELEDT